MKKRCKNCGQYQKRIEDLEAEMALLKFHLEDLRSQRYKSKKKKPPKNDDPKPEPKKKGGLFGHKGWFRKKPEKIDKVEEVSLSACPCCGDKDLTEYDETEEHIQEDIVLPKLEATLFRKKVYYCKKCKKTVTGKGKNELPQSYIGPLAKAWAVFLKFGIKISDRDIKNIFKALNLRIVPSSVVGFRDQLKREASSIYEQLKEALKKGRFIHADETGTRLDGANAWRWKFSNKNISVTHTDESRGQKVVEEVLGEKYNGVLISDFLSAYNRIMTKAKQRCLVHLLRDLKKVIEYWHEDEEVLRYCKRLKKILEEAIELYKEYKEKEWDADYNRRRKLIIAKAKDFSFPNPNKKILQTFAKRLNRHKDELFVFLYVKGIDYHNNHAEQQIRPDVILRKITFGNRSEKGAQVHDVAMSILQTAKLNSLDPVETVKDILLPTRKNPLSGIIAQPP